MGNVFTKVEECVNKNALIYCICLTQTSPENNQRALHYIKKSFFVQHCTHRGESPLYLSLLHNKDFITLMLLTHGTSPHITQEPQSINIVPYPYNPLLHCLSVKNISQLKLLTFFGTSIEGFSQEVLWPFTSEILQIYAEARARYIRIQELESFVKSDAPLDQQLKTLHELQKIWQTVTQEEDNPLFREYYAEQALHCKNRAGNLQAGFRFDDKITISNPRRDEALEPLLNREAHTIGKQHPC